MIRTNHKKLVAAGCSFTEGEGLSDPDTQSWPALVAKKLNLDCVNLGQRGASNDYITNSIMEYALQNDTYDCFFIIAYSDYLRVDFCNSINKTVVHLTPTSRKYPKLRDMFYSEFAEKNYFFKKFALNVIKTQAWFETKNINYMMLNGLTNLDADLYYEENKFLFENINHKKYKNFNNYNFMRIINTDGRQSDGHPNEVGHERIADQIYKWLVTES